MLVFSGLMQKYSLGLQEKISQSKSLVKSLEPEQNGNRSDT